MKQRHFFKVTKADPALICPAAGYVKDPINTNYGFDPAIIPNPSNEQIILLASDEGDRNFYFTCSISNSGQFNVKIYGNNNSGISDTNYNNNGYPNFLIPLGQGTPDGYRTLYKIVISPVSGANSITKFQTTYTTPFDLSGCHILGAKFNTPNLTTLYQAFLINRYVRYVEFVCTCNSLTTLEQAFSSTSRLETLILPTSLNALTTMKNMLNYSGLKKLQLNGTYQQLTTIESICFNSFVIDVELKGSFPLLNTMIDSFKNSLYLRSADLSGSFPELGNFSNTFNNCPNLSSVIFPSALPKVNTAYGLFTGCTFLAADLVFPEMPLCTTIENIVNNCRELKSLKFTGNMNLCTIIYYCIFGTLELTELQLPVSMNALSTMLSSQFSSISPNFKKLTLPQTWQPASPNGTQSPFYIQNTITEITKVLACHSFAMSLNYSYYLSLLRFDQPQFKAAQLIFSQQGGQNAPRSVLEYVDVDFSVCTLATLNYASIPYSEMLRICNKLPAHSGAVRPASFSWNPCNSSFIAKAGAAFSAGTTTLTISSGGTSGIQVGMFFSHLSGSSNRAITFTEAGSLVNRTSHGFPSGLKITFTSLTGMTEISVNTAYYVVNPTANSFQISNTKNGAPIAFTGSGNGNLRFYPVVTNVINGTQVSLNVGGVDISNSSAIFTNFPYMDYLVKGWDVTANGLL